MLSLARWFGLVGCALLLSGCWPGSRAPLDEQNESNFLTGKARVQARDWDGAIESFEKSLEANPHSASAHFELALIYEQQKQDFATALYHYEKVRRLRPNAYPADTATARLEGCKRELAKSVTQPPNMDALQRENERLQADNQRLRQMVTEWQNYYQGRSGTMPGRGTNPVANPSGGRPGTTLGAGGGDPGGGRPDLGSTSGNPDPGPHNIRPGGTNPGLAGTRTHKVAVGDNPSKIAARYGIKLNALVAANPGLEARRMKVGQTLVIPSH